MTKLKDPIEIYRDSLAGAPALVETQPPVIERAEVWPYPDLKRLWVRVQVSAFAAFPNLTLTVTDPDGAVACSMFMVEIRDAYQSITLHLRREPAPGASYQLEIELTRDETILDVRTIDFTLVFREPEQKTPATE
ncbi:MAG: hypothetical protein IT320_16190 [Anaerolineae bacterium]|nr:hypothetical protein [Anaerolineae bacterium]